MEAIAALDRWLFLLINSTMWSYYADPVMRFVTEKFNFSGAIIAAAILILILGKRSDRRGLIVLVLTVVVADALCNGLKHIIMRPRPCIAIPDVRLLVGCSKSFSMPSGHATNIFAAMVFLSLRYKKIMPAFLALAAIVAYSRVYVGVHYPIDVIFGAILGALAAFFFTWGERQAIKFYKDRYEKKLVIEDEFYKV